MAQGVAGDGVIARVGTRKLAKGLGRLGVPIVNLRSAILDVNYPRVGSDNVAVAHLGAEHLLDLGLKNFAFCNTPRGFHLGHDARADAFAEAVGRPSAAATRTPPSASPGGIHGRRSSGTCRGGYAHCPSRSASWRATTRRGSRC